MKTARRDVERQFRKQTAEAVNATQFAAVRPILLEQEAQMFQQQALALQQKAQEIRQANQAQQQLLADARVKAEQARAAAAAAVQNALPAVPAAAAAGGNQYYFRTPAGLVPVTIVRDTGLGNVEINIPGVGPRLVSGRDLVPAAALGGAGAVGAGLGLGLGAYGGLGMGLGPYGGLGLGLGPFGYDEDYDYGRSSRRRSSSTRTKKAIAKAQLASNPYYQNAVLSAPCDDPRYDDCEEVLGSPLARTSLPYFY
jgi:hypothetical protein